MEDGPFVQPPPGSGPPDPPRVRPGGGGGGGGGGPRPPGRGGGLLKVQAPAAAVELAQKLGIKGGISLQMDQVVQPVALVTSVEGTPNIIGWTAVRTSGVASSNVILAPSNPCWIRKVVIGLGQGPADVEVTLARGVSAFPAPTSSGDGAITNQSNGEGLTSYRCRAYNVSTVPGGSRSIHILRVGDDAPLTIDYSDNPIALGPRDWNQPSDLAQNTIALYSVSVGTSSELSVSFEIEIPSF